MRGLEVFEDNKECMALSGKRRCSVFVYLITSLHVTAPAIPLAQPN